MTIGRTHMKKVAVQAILIAVVLLIAVIAEAHVARAAVTHSKTVFSFEVVLETSKCKLDSNSLPKPLSFREFPKDQNRNSQRFYSNPWQKASGGI